MSNKIGPFPYRTRLMQLLYDHPMTLEEVGEIFGVSRERIRQLVDTRGPQVPFNYDNGSSVVPSWLVELVDLGAVTAVDAAELIGCSGASVSRKTKTRIRRFPTHPSLPRAPAAASVWIEARNLILAAAWMDGASMRDWQDLTGWSKDQVGVVMVRMRRKGYCLPKRRGAGKAAS